MENIITDIYWEATRLFIEYTAEEPIGLLIKRGKAEYEAHGAGIPFGLRPDR